MWGSFDVYSGNGELSFIAKRISVAGEGPLQRQVEALRAKLKAEGLGILPASGPFLASARASPS